MLEGILVAEEKYANDLRNFIETLGTDGRRPLAANY